MIFLNNQVTKHFVVFDINLSLHLYASRFCWTQNRIGPNKFDLYKANKEMDKPPQINLLDDKTPRPKRFLKSYSKTNHLR